MSRRVLVGMSGGLDSSMAALLLKQQGFEVVGATFRMWDYISEHCESKNTGCCSIEAIHQAASFAQTNGFQHIVPDFREIFAKEVIQHFVNEYAQGRTPNPCVVCNAKIKWGQLLQTADALNCDYIATGHYASIQIFNGRHVLVNAKDSTKDQTYFLWQLTSEQLSRTLFPLSNFTKEEIRLMAKKTGFQQLAQKRESQEICFIQDNNYRNFIQQHFPHIMDKVSEGNVFDKKGNFLGKHKGYINYTIGQRKGLGIATGKPAYVIAINANKNTVTLGTQEDLLTDTIHVNQLNFPYYKTIPKQFEAEVKIRYNTRRVLANITYHEDYLKVIFKEKVSAATPGQSAVFYSGNICMGGGVIFQPNEKTNK